MEIEDLHLACLASVPAGGGPCQLDDDEVGNGTWKPPKNASGSSARWRLFSKVTEMDRIKAQARTPSILSCSRRTDVPWAFLRQYLKAFREGFLYVRSPVTGEMDPVCVIPYNATTGKGVLCISWWSKNYSKWIEEFQKEDSILHSYPLHMFNFTVNSDDKVLEPGLSSCLKERLGQVTWLAQHFGAHALNVRFDPIVHYRKLAGTDSSVHDNLQDFEEIVRHIGQLGIDHITFSFCKPYKQSVRNMRVAGVELVALSDAQQRKVLDRLLPMAHRHGVEMRCCCDSPLFGHRCAAEAKVEVRKVRRWGAVGKDKENIIMSKDAEFLTVKESRCLDARLADRLAKEKGLSITFPHQKDRGQREQCNCTASREIGQYELQCPHSCLYCYANPKPVETALETDVTVAPV